MSIAIACRVWRRVSAVSASNCRSVLHNKASDRDATDQHDVRESGAKPDVVMKPLVVLHLPNALGPLSGTVRNRDGAARLYE